MKIKFTEDNDLRKLPTLATNKSAAYDLYVPKDTVIEEGRNIVPLGFCMELDPGTAAEIHPRSGHASKGMEGYEIIPKIFSKTGIYGVEQIEEGQYASLTPARMNADVEYGLIDEDYRNECGVIVINNGCPFLVKRGSRIAQMLLISVVKAQMEVVDELSETDRKGGFGHTGN